MEEYYGLGAIPIITGMVQVAKVVWPDASERVWPLVSLALGVSWNVLLAWRLDIDLFTGAVFGLVIGLSSAGFYSMARTYTEKSKAPVISE